MNMILHNITRFTIENGDTLEDPLILENGQVRKFDRVLANPPFSQNYSRANMKFPSRFREWCPETGKKADLMFVQHMLASLKPDGHMATIMPHGVLFRGGKEKLIREIFINDDVIEAIISLPPGLFYGTGIPACVLVLQQEQARRPARTRCSSSMPTANTPKARPRTSSAPRTSRRSTSSSPTSGRFPNTAAWWTRPRSSRPTTTTSTSAAMWTTPPIRSRRTCRPT